MQRAVNTKIEEEMFSMWSAYIHCYATDAFSMGPPRGYVNSTQQNQIRENGNENGVSPPQSKEEGFR
jgi:hypothetical protein